MDHAKLLRLCPPSLALALIVSASALPYIFRLGFYSDDWAFLSTMSGSPRQSVVSLYGLLDQNPNLHARPVQTFHMIMLYKAFGLEPLGYHLVNTLTLAATAVFMHLALRQLQIPAFAAFAASLLFALSPAYGTARFWFAAFGYVLMMALYFLSLYADLRALSGEPGTVDWRWKATALAALLLCALGYEIMLPLLAANMLLLAGIGLRRGPSRERVLSPWSAVVFFGSSILILATVLAYKVVTAIGVGTSGGILEHLLKLGRAAAVVQFGSYGLALPPTTWWAAQQAGPAITSAAIMSGTLTWGYLTLLRRRHGPAARTADGLRMLTYGSLALILGYAIFLVTPRFSPASTGLTNRIHIGGALGVALLIIAAAMLLVNRIRRPALREFALPAFVGLLVTCFTLITGAVSTYWIQSYRDQRAIVERIEAALPDVPPGAAIILAGRCPYRGPAVVFESSWDLSGALSVRYGNEIAANVVTPRLEVHSDALTSTIYDGDDGRYPFGPHLYLYDDRERTVRVLHDRRSAEAALSGTGTGSRIECAPSAEGWGEPVLPFERLMVTAGLIEPGLR